MAAMVVSLVVGKGLWWHNIHTKFRENRSVCLIVAVGERHIFIHT